MSFFNSKKVFMDVVAPPIFESEKLENSQKFRHTEPARMIRNGETISLTTDLRWSLKITNKNGTAKTRKMPAGFSAIAKPPNIPAHKNDLRDADFAAKIIGPDVR